MEIVVDMLNFGGDINDLYSFLDFGWLRILDLNQFFRVASK